MAYTGQTINENTTDQLGAFSGYIRRPIPSVNGMTAQIFGENGEDADTILALSLTKYQDIEVFVNIYLIKDSLGKIMKQQDNYPLVSSFVGFVRRSMPKKDGMIAQFYAPNGEHADSVSNLSKSNLQDCLVFVDVRSKKSINHKDIIAQENIEEITKNYLGKITIGEKAEVQKKSKQFRKMNECLELSDFLNRIEVISGIGNVEEYKDWLASTQTCSNLQEKHCMNQSQPVAIDGLLKPFNYLPFCEDHLTNATDSFHIEKNMLYYEMKQRLLLKQWVWNKFKEKFSFEGNSEPNPSLIIEWAASKNLAKYLPKNYQAII